MLRLLVIVVLWLSLSFAQAVAAESRLSVAPYLGVYRPGLGDLVDKEFKAPVAGIVDVIDITGSTVRSQVLFPNPLPKLGLGANAGLEFLWKLSDKYEFIVGGGTWEAYSRALAEGGFYLQGEASDVVNERTAKVSYNEFYFGFKYNLLRSPKKYKAYYRLTLNEIFDIDYREDLIFLFTSGVAEGVKKSMILESQATGLMMLQPGFGLDYFVRDWLSFGFDVSYMIGFKRVNLGNGTSKVDFLSTDAVSIWLPQRVDPVTGNLQYLSQNPVDENDYSPIKLSFDGWKSSFKMNIYF